MKNLNKIILVLTIIAVFCSGCASTTYIRTSNAENAKVYINDQYVGNTPHKHTETKIVGNKLDVRIEKEGYEPIYTTIRRNSELNIGALIGGLFVLFPFLWIMDYDTNNTYELEAIESEIKL